MLDLLAEKLKQLQSEALEKLSAASLDEKTLEDFKVKYLGREGKITHILKEIGKLSSEDRPKLGKIANEVKGHLTQKVDFLFSELKKTKFEREIETQRLDISLPERNIERGHLHPITQTLNEIIQFFSKYGFQVAEGPEIETEYYNFDALHTPKNHPARDMQDTFYISDDVVLRTHTSPVQIRVMEKYKPPLRIVSPGVVYRRDQDISHTPMFHQVEGLLVDEGISMAHLKGILISFVHKFFSRATQVRFRPSFFPFTEPSAELDIKCVICGGRGCRVCKESGWVEVIGCGMVHPAVFRGVRYDTEKWNGFAFGMGIERIAMLQYRIDDIRLFFENDLRFLRQF